MQPAGALVSVGLKVFHSGLLQSRRCFSIHTSMFMTVSASLCSLPISLTTGRVQRYASDLFIMTKMCLINQQGVGSLQVSPGRGPLVTDSTNTLTRGEVQASLYSAAAKCFAQDNLCFLALVLAFSVRIKEPLTVPFYSHSLGSMGMEARLIWGQGRNQRVASVTITCRSTVQGVPSWIYDTVNLLLITIKLQQGFICGDQLSKS